MSDPEQLRRDAEKSYQDLERSFDEQNPDTDYEFVRRTAKLLRKVVKANPEDLDAWVKLIDVSGFFFSNDEDNDAATERAISIAYEAMRGRETLMLALGELFTRLRRSSKRYHLAVDCFRLYIDAVPDDPEGWRMLGGYYKIQEQPSEAIVCFNKALELRPAFPVVLKFLAEIHDEMGNYKRAEEYYELSIKADSSSPHIYTDMSKFQREMAGVILPGRSNERMEKAISFIKEAIKLREAEGDHATLSRYYAEMGRFDDAETEYKIATEINNRRMKTAH